MTYQPTFTDEEVGIIIGMWLAGRQTPEIAMALERSTSQVQDKIRTLRRSGHDLPVRGDGRPSRVYLDRAAVSARLEAQRAERDREAAERRNFPEGTIFEDDPRAISMNQPRYVPMRNAFVGSPSSSLYGARVLSTTSRQGAVT